MKKFLFFVIFLIFFSSTWVTKIFIDPKDANLLSNLEKELRFKNSVFLRKVLPNIERKNGIVIIKTIYLPWCVYLKYEKEKTLLHIEYQGKEYFYNQKLEVMRKYVPFDGTIRVIGANDLDTIAEIVRDFKDFKIKKLIFYKKFFEINGDRFVIKISLEDYKEKKKKLLEILKVLDLNNKTLDFRFSIPAIGGI